MTEVAAAPETSAPRELGRISHWIGGEIVPGASARSGPVYKPATGAQQAEVDFASADEGDPAVAAAKDAVPAWRAPSLSKRAEPFFRPPDLPLTTRAEIAR